MQTNGSMALILKRLSFYGKIRTGWRFLPELRMRSVLFLQGESLKPAGLLYLPFELIESGSYLCAMHEERRLELMKADEFDKKFDSGKDITEHLDYSKAKRPGKKQKRVNVDFPVWMIQALDQEAERIGVPRQSVIKVWIAERLDQMVQA